MISRSSDWSILTCLVLSCSILACPNQPWPVVTCHDLPQPVLAYPHVSKPVPGVHKTGIRGIQDTIQIVDGKTNDIEKNDKKGGSKLQTLKERVHSEIKISLI